MSLREKQQQNLLEMESTGRVFLRYLIPSMIGMVLMALNFVVDGVMVGNKLGSVALAGVNIAGPIYTIFVAMSIWIGVGGATLYSQSMGARDYGRARFIFTHSIILITIFTVIIGLIAYAFHHQLVYALGANEATAPFATDYMNVFLMLGFVFTLENTLSIFVRNNGNPNLAMASLIVTAISNFVLNFIILYVLELGVRETAYGTILAAALGILVLSLHFFTKKNTLRLVNFRFEKSLFMMTMMIGFPSFLAEIGVSVFTIAHNNAFSRLAGTDGLAAFSIVNYAHSVMLLMFLGIGSAIQPLVSYYHGAKDEKRKRETVRIAIFTAMGAGISITLMGQVAAPFIVNLFGDFSSDVKELATIGIRIFFSGYILMGVNFVMMTYFQSIGQVKMAAWITIGREFIFMLIFLLTLPLIFGTNAAWLAIPLSEVVIFLTVLLYLKRKGSKIWGKAQFNKMIN